MLKSHTSKLNRKMAPFGLLLVGAAAIPAFPDAPALAMRCANCVCETPAAVKAPAKGSASAARPAEQALKVGHTREFAGALTINFVGVNGDSRCPSDVDCVWAGNAKVALRVRDKGGKVHAVDLNTGLEPRAASAGGYDITLSSLTPYPKSTETIDKKSYIATVKVARQAAEPGNTQAAWQPLFGGEEWYRDEAGKEQLFSGRLEAVKVDPDRVTTLMRTNYYQLGGRMLYTGTHKHALLDSLIGKKVEIRGKAVDMALEGQMVNEIWPAAIRVVP